MPAANNQKFINTMTLKIPAAAEKAARAAMEKGAVEITDMMKRLVPKSSRPLKYGRTQRLRDSIGWTWTDAQPGAKAIGKSEKFGGEGRNAIVIYAGSSQTLVANRRGVKFQLAMIQEFGTKHRAANPFFYPSWRAMRNRTRSRIRREIKYAIEAYSGGLVGKDIAA
jgi:HK97 gp10 family phage protein